MTLLPALPVDWLNSAVIVLMGSIIVTSCMVTGYRASRWVGVDAGVCAFVGAVAGVAALIGWLG